MQSTNSENGSPYLLHVTLQNFSTSRFWTIISVIRSRDVSVQCGHENVSLAHIFEAERLFTSAVIETQEYFCHFIVLEGLNTHIFASMLINTVI